VEKVTQERCDRLMWHQQAISAALLKSRIGKTIEVIVDLYLATKLALKPGEWRPPKIATSVILGQVPSGLRTAEYDDWFVDLHRRASLPVSSWPQ
jgi:hypothetical protein